MQRDYIQNRRRGVAGLVVAASLLAALAGCSFGLPPRSQPVTYDLGPPVSRFHANPGFPAVIVVPQATAPAPIDGTGIVYRLAYVDPARAEVYAESRWTERINVLFTQRMRSYLAGMGGRVVTPGEGARADYALRIELEDFSQHFDSEAASRAVVRLRATLVDAGSRALRVQRIFSAERPAAPNAAGGVKALGEAADAVIGEIAAWTAQNVIAAGNR